MSKAWPLPALLSWLACWLLFILAGRLGMPPAAALSIAAAFGVGLSFFGATPWRRALIALGFPLSLAASGLAGSPPAWAWLLPLGLLIVVYPLRAWRDAPLFPTPGGALAGLAQLVPLAPGARIVDAGCGLGDGLRELRREYPQAALAGWEWSWPLRLACALRCRDATVRHTDIWAADWSPFALVYLFQRPESMARAAAKAMRELQPGAWLASLEFDAPGLAASKVLECADGRRVWLYQVPMRRRA
ncbi:MAG TPA: class I SAM-dependent methyltransferase [Burkholderiaceae bacterium]|nr:class I SAM-dependent methyltransferase [Burkholderiaceae bacterium]